MIATLAMYDWPQQSHHWDRLWRAIAQSLGARGVAAHGHLTRGGDLWQHWRDPGLILGQTCGLPYRTGLHGRVELIGTFDHGLPDCAPGHYTSVVVAAADRSGSLADLLAGTLAINAPDSQSGWAAIHDTARRDGMTIPRARLSGSHRDSARMVAEGEADIAAIDAETWRLVERFAPGIAGRLRVVMRTPPTPGLPLVAATGTDADTCRDAIRDALAAVDPGTLSALDIEGFVVIPPEDYLAVPVPPPPPLRVT